MIWSYVQKKVKKSLYPDLYYWSHNLPRFYRRVIFLGYDLNIKFEYIPERWDPLLYFWYFDRLKYYHYPTDDDIKFFYFTLFKKNGFLFIIICLIIYKNYLFDLIILLINSGIAFYLIVHLIYTILLLRKNIYLLYLLLKILPYKCIPILIIIFINRMLNILFNFKSKPLKWYF